MSHIIFSNRKKIALCPRRAACVPSAARDLLSRETRRDESPARGGQARARRAAPLRKQKAGSSSSRLRAHRDSLGMTCGDSVGGSEFEVEGELDLARACAFGGPIELRKGSDCGAKNGIDFNHVCVVEKIERFGDEVEMLVFAEGKIFHEAKIEIHGGGSFERIARKAERARGEREGVAAIGIHAGERIDGASALSRENRRELDVT